MWKIEYNNDVGPEDETFWEWRKRKMWKIEYNNDVGPEDETFWEWWEITNGEIVFETLKEKDAQWLCKILNQDEGCDSPYLIDKEKSENLPK